MRYVGGFLALIGLVLAALSLTAREPQPDDLKAFDPDKPLSQVDKAERLRRVQPERSSPEAVRRLLGEPSRKARQILYQRAREQWLYEAPFEVRLEFEYVRGQEPHLLSVQPVVPGKP
jgi:hypothetical protein